MEIKIRAIANGWLVSAGSTPSADDPLGQRNGLPETFADTREAAIGLISERILDLWHPSDGPRR